MDMQALIDGMNAQESATRAKTQMTFGQLIERLGQLPPNTLIAAGGPDSYRGYYCDIALDPTEPTTAGELLRVCRQEMGQMMTGYKGGDYPIHARIPVWVSEYGRCSGDRLIEIRDDGALITRSEED